MWTRLAVSTLALTVASGCTFQHDPSTIGPKTLVGALGAAAAGGLIGAAAGGGDPLITAAGALGGLLVGGGIGSALDAQDRYVIQRTAQRAATAPTGQPVAWQAPSGTHGTYTPGPVVYRSSGLCRPYQMTVVIQGTLREVRGLACQRPDGTWRLEEQP